MKVSVVSLFPEMFEAVSQYGVTGRAVSRGLLNIQLFNPRTYTLDKHQTVDDRPYGGGPGMGMQPEPLRLALADAKAAAGADAKVIYMSPQGRRLDQAGLEELAKQPLVILAGRYRREGDRPQIP